MNSPFRPAFLPNRNSRAESPPDAGLHRALPQILAAVQECALVNLRALLAGEGPVAAPRDVLSGFFAPRPRLGASARDSVSRKRTLRRPGDAERTESLEQIVIRLPEQLGSRYVLGQGGGDALILPAVLQQALSDGAFRLQIGDTVRRFLAERVLFSPGPAPCPAFSAGGLSMLVASQDRHGEKLGPGYEPLHAAAGALRQSQQVCAWDQWLLRRMQAAPGWQLPSAYEALPWVAWPAPGISTPVLPPDADRTAWESILDLVP